MTPDEYKNLIEWHRHTQSRLKRIEIAIGLIFVMIVVVPFMEAIGVRVGG